VRAEGARAVVAIEEAARVAARGRGGDGGGEDGGGGEGGGGEGGGEGGGGEGGGGDGGGGDGGWRRRVARVAVRWRRIELRRGWVPGAA